MCAGDITELNTKNAVFAQIDSISINVMDFQALLKEARDLIIDQIEGPPQISDSLTIPSEADLAENSNGDPVELRDNIYDAEIEDILAPPGIEAVYEGEWNASQEKKVGFCNFGA
jgi:hypothetical protein